MKLPKISVVMPVYNAERYVTEAVRSILNQTFSDFEFIIVNDGSTDGSLEILRRFAEQDSRIRLISRGNTGIVGARNEGLAAARGEFVAPMDADDVSVAERFAWQVKHLEAHEDCVVVGGQALWIDEAGRPIGVDRQPLVDSEIQSRLLRGYCVLAHSAVLMRREAALAAGGYKEAFCPAEDMELWLRLGEMGELANLEQVLLHYRLHDKSVSAERQEDQINAWRRACEEAWERRGTKGTFEVEGAWRPGGARVSRHEFTVRYGWMAYRQGYRRTALVYGARAVRLHPLAESGWRLLICALVRRSPSEHGNGPVVG